MKEPVEVELIEVLTPKGEIIPGVSLRRDAFAPEGKESDPWYPEKVLIPLVLKDSFRTIFPDEVKNAGTECKIIEDIGARHVLALYGAPPPLRDKLVAPVEPPTVPVASPSETIPASAPTPPSPTPFPQG